MVRPSDLSGLVREASNLVRSSIPRSVELEFDLAEHLPSIEADTGQMHQVIMNLVIYGAEAMGEGNTGKVRISTKLLQVNTESLRRDYPADTLSPAAYVVLEVTDTGSGMDENTRSRIFDPFFTTKFTGRGLGLASVQGIVRGHRGAIRVQSKVGLGSTFTILFPAVHALRDEPTKVELKPEDLHGTGLVLVVDDDEIAQCTMRAILERNGYQVLTAANGEIAVREVREHKDELALVILDLTMPVMGGEEAFAEINVLAPDLPVILTSGYDAGEAVNKFGSNALAGFIQKPSTVTNLLEIVKAALEK